MAILLTPKNQNNRCPICKTTNLTIRFCRVSHAAMDMVMGAGLSTRAEPQVAARAGGLVQSEWSEPVPMRDAWVTL